MVEPASVESKVYRESLRITSSLSDVSADQRRRFADVFCRIVYGSDIDNAVAPHVLELSLFDKASVLNGVDVFHSGLCAALHGPDPFAPTPDIQNAAP
jgi:hypothetical protein